MLAVEGAVEDLAAIIVGTSSPLAVRRNDCPLLGKPGAVLFSGGTKSRGRRSVGT